MDKLENVNLIFNDLLSVPLFPVNITQISICFNQNIKLKINDFVHYSKLGNITFNSIIIIVIKKYYD